MRLLLVVVSLIAALRGASSSPFQVEILTDANFKEKVHGNEGDTWLVEFYAPWCSHCKRLNPVLDEVAPLVGSKLRIGKVDTTVHGKVAKEYGIQAYPTLKVIKTGEGGSAAEYEGARTKEAFLDFAERLSTPSPVELKTPDEVTAYRKEHEIAFLLAPSPVELKTPDEVAAYRREHEIAFLLGIDDKDDESPLRKTYDKVAQSLKHTASFAVASSKALGSGYNPLSFLAKLEKGEEPSYYPNTSYLPTLSKEQLTTWIHDNNMPLVTAYSGHNFRKLGEMGKLMVIGVVNPKDTEATENFLEGLRELARTQRELIAKHYVLGYLDGVRWASFVKQFHIDQSQLPRMFILDFPKQSFYEDPEVDEIDEIETFLVDVAGGKVPAQRQGALQSAIHVWHRFVEWLPWSLVIFIPIGLLLSTCFWPSLWNDPGEEELRKAQEKLEDMRKATTDGKGKEEEEEDDGDEEEDEGARGRGGGGGGRSGGGEPKDATRKKNE